MNLRLQLVRLAIVGGLLAPRPVEASSLSTRTPPLSNRVDTTRLAPASLAVTDGGQTLFIACSAANEVWVYDVPSDRVKRRIPVPASPSGLALNSTGERLFVTCAAPKSRVCVIRTAGASVVRTFSAGHTAMAPVLARDESSLFVCHRFNNEVAMIDLPSGEITRRVAVPREPVAMAITTDGTHLLVANHLHAGRSDLDVVAASVSVIEIETAKVVREIDLPNGGGLLRDVSISPDGRYACVTHLLSRYHLPTTQIERGWMNTNAISLIDLATFQRIATVLLDNVDRGAANPWAAAWTSDSRQLVVTHAGTHELSLIDFPGLLRKLGKRAAAPDDPRTSRGTGEVANDLSFLVDLRRRIPLAGKGPRALAIAGTKVFVANYFSDSLEVLDLSDGLFKTRSIALGSTGIPRGERLGEFYFNDATICFQGWQSCASCHSSDARVDGLNWDNLNDGIGNPKNVKSLLLAHRTPPSMALGVRANAEISVRAGIRHALFTVQPDEVPEAIDAYLKSLKPIPSPYLVNGKLSSAAERGKALFHSRAVKCAGCHRPSLFTDLKRHDVGTRGINDHPTDKFDTPTLIEAWRSRPYLHDGSAATIHEVLTTRNPKGRHGSVEHLKPEELNDLATYVLSL